MRIKSNNKICGVCGDKALGCNFNAITCESCKAFFRRNALLAKNFKCPFSEHCEITPITRRFCQKCRLDKCFSIGMCKNLILSEEEKKVKRKKILENRSRKQMGSGAFKKGFKKMKKGDFSSHLNNELKSVQEYGAMSEENSTSTTISDNVTTEERDNANSVINKEIELISSSDILVTSSSDVSMISSMLNNNHQNQMVVDQTFDKTECESSSSKSLLQSEIIDKIDATLKKSGESLDISTSVVHLARYAIGDNQMPAMESNPLESILCEAIKLEFQTFSPINRNNSKELNDAERAKLNELIVANKVVTAPLDEDLMDSMLGPAVGPQRLLDHADHALLDIINFTAIIIRRLIKMAKKINAFKNLCQEDQVALLKGGSTEIMILRSAINYNSNNQSWQIPKKHQTFNINMDVLKLAKNNAYQIIEKFMKAFDHSWGADENIILIMCAIALFTPDRPKVVHKDVIKLEQNSYYYLLRRYLECTFPGCEAKSTFLKLLQTISELQMFNEELVNIYLDVNPSQLEPLLIELFDVKP